MASHGWHGVLSVPALRRVGDRFPDDAVMNQREAMVTILDFVKTQGPDEPRLLRAIKVMERRAEVLRFRYERRNAARFARQQIIAERNSAGADQNATGPGEARREAEFSTR